MQLFHAPGKTRAITDDEHVIGRAGLVPAMRGLSGEVGEAARWDRRAQRLEREKDCDRRGQGMASAACGRSKQKEPRNRRAGPPGSCGQEARL
jgi:hypothetical protein